MRESLAGKNLFDNSDIYSGPANPVLPPPNWDSVENAAAASASIMTTPEAPATSVAPLSTNILPPPSLESVDRTIPPPAVGIPRPDGLGRHRATGPVSTPASMPPNPPYGS